MGFGERKIPRSNVWRIVGLLAMTTAVAACSNDATRLQDSFYTGAIPQSSSQPLQQPSYTQPQPSYGQAQPSYGAAPNYPAQSNDVYAAAPAASSAVSRSQLPPPPATPAAPQQVQPQPVAQQPSSQVAAAPSQANPAPAAKPASDGKSVIVQAGDSLNAIARRSGVSVADLRAANGLASDNIRIGQVLTLPSGSGGTRVAALGTPPTTLQEQASRAGQTANDASPAPATAQPKPAAQASTPAPAPENTTVAEQTEQQTAALAPASTGISQFRWPVQGRVVKSFGDKIGSRRNDGVNISVPRGTPVKAAENGVVIYAGEGLKEFGKTVLVKHDNGLVTVYGHADEILVERGATVRRGQDIAKAGMTGDTDAPMLHFEVRKDSSPVNPMTYLQ